MKSLSDYILESKIEIHDMNAFTNSSLGYEVFAMINDAIDLYDGDLKDITTNDIIDLVDLNSKWCFEHYDDDERSKWMQVKPGKDAKVSAYILVGGTIYQLNDLNNFKYKNDFKTLIYGITEDGERFSISVPMLLKYLKENPNSDIISPNGKSIEFTEDFLKEL